jgi:hypothetical protein
VVPGHHDDLAPLLAAELAALDKRIRSARARESKWHLHGYSRLLDLGRLLFLMRLLISFPDLEASDPATRAELEAWVSPLPQGDLADRAAVFLRRLHGDCYADTAALRADLAWLEANGFTSAAPVLTPIQLAELGPVDQPLRRPSLPQAGGVHGGHPPMGDGPVFVRVITLLRHRLQTPFDRTAGKGESLHQHLIAATEAIPGSYQGCETASLRKDIEKILTRYGFRSRQDNGRHGDALGTALLVELDERLGWAGIDTSSPAPVRSNARHTVVDGALVRPDSLAAAAGAEAIERAIFEQRRVQLHRYDSAASFPGGPDGELRLLPLQLIVHNIGWDLIDAEDSIGRQEGVIPSERLDRHPQHLRSLRLAERLLPHCGGISFGDDLDSPSWPRSRSAATGRACRPD